MASYDLLCFPYVPINNMYRWTTCPSGRLAPLEKMPRWTKWPGERHAPYIDMPWSMSCPFDNIINIPICLCVILYSHQSYDLLWPCMIPSNAHYDLVWSCFLFNPTYLNYVRFQKVKYILNTLHFIIKLL